jgi:hypothetical protein
MQLGLTIPLQRHLKLKNLSYGEPLDRQYCWDLHVITLQGRPSLLAVHCATRYTFTLFDVTMFQWEATGYLSPRPAPELRSRGYSCGNNGTVSR